MTANERWLSALWPKVRSYLPAPPAVVVEVGCGSLGGFVPMLQESGYQALGVDPGAPEGASFHRIEFERSELPSRVDGVVACASLHHVAKPAEALDKIAKSLTPGGVVVVVEWDWESFDETTAQWCFERLGSPEPEGWLHRRRDAWIASGQPWVSYLRSWADQEGLHSGRALLRELDQRLHRQVCSRGPYFFPALAEASEADERDAINAGQIRATRIDYVGRLRS